MRFGVVCYILCWYLMSVCMFIFLCQFGILGLCVICARQNLWNGKLADEMFAWRFDWWMLNPWMMICRYTPMVQFCCCALCLHACMQQEDGCKMHAPSCILLSQLWLCLRSEIVIDNLPFDWHIIIYTFVCVFNSIYPYRYFFYFLVPMNAPWDGNKDKKTCPTSEGTESEEFQWKALPQKVERKIDDHESIPIPKFPTIVDRCLKENKSQEVWDMVSVSNNICLKFYT